MADIQIVVSLGPTSTDTYYLGVGRQAVYNNLPRGLTQRLQSGKILNTRLRYISLDKNARWWCLEEVTSGPTVISETPHGSALWKAIRDKSTGGFVTFPDFEGSQPTTQPFYFVASKRTGNWAASLPETYTTTIQEIKAIVPSFSDSLKWIIFGKGGTHIYQLSGGYMCCMEGEHKDKNHPLTKALMEFDPDFNPSVPHNEWMIDRGSCISLHDHRYFFLKFQNTRSTKYEVRYCLHPHLEEKLTSMIAAAKTAREQSAIDMDRNILNLRRRHETQAIVNREYEMEYTFDGSTRVVYDYRNGLGF